ncbi:MAG: hypothetical protein ACYDDT_02620 [Sulfuricella sp.]
MDTRRDGVADFYFEHGLVSVVHDIKERSDDWRELCRTAGEAPVETVGLSGLGAVSGSSSL